MQWHVDKCEGYTLVDSSASWTNRIHTYSFLQPQRPNRSEQWKYCFLSRNDSVMRWTRFR